MGGIDLPETMQPRPAESMMLVPVMQNCDGCSPPLMRACPSSSCPTVPACPPEAVSVKQQVEFVHEMGLDFATVARARMRKLKLFMMAQM
jgi:hypothetical protein